MGRQSSVCRCGAKRGVSLNLRVRQEKERARKLKRKIKGSKREKEEWKCRFSCSSWSFSSRDTKSCFKNHLFPKRKRVFL